MFLQQGSSTQGRTQSLDAGGSVAVASGAACGAGAADLQGAVEVAVVSCGAVGTMAETIANLREA